MRFSTLLTVVALTAAASACSAPLASLPEATLIAAPNPSQVESVIFLVGDGGNATRENSPTLMRMQLDVESWSENLGRDSAVVVLFLGDIVYPLGMNPPGSADYSRDSTVVMGQVDILAGPAAVRTGARGYFIAGNHDWGLEEEWSGYDRLKILADFLTVAKATRGVDVRLAPDAGTGGPFILDLGTRSRILLLDTAWWVLDGGQRGIDDRPAVLNGIDEAMAGAGDRHVFIAAHHPFRSAGPHGGEFSFWRTMGIRYLLTRSGAMLQDLTSVPYREFESGVRSIFSRHGPPLAFIGGHEHTLQVFQSVTATDPAYSLVSGSASKLNSIGIQPGMQFGASVPGYMKLVVETDGGVTLFVEATPEEYLDCSSASDLNTCMVEGVAAYETLFSARLN